MNKQNLQQRLELLFSRENQSISLQAAIDFYLAQCRVVASTKNAYAQSLALLCAEIGSTTPLSLITRHMMADFVDSLSAERDLYANHGNRPATRGKFSPATAHKHFGHCNTFFEWCATEPLEIIKDGQIVELFLINRNPMKRLTAPPIPAQPPKAIDLADFHLMLEAAQTHYPRNARVENQERYIARNTALLMFLASTGCRSEGARESSISQITWLDDGAKVWVWEKGKGRQKKGGYVYLYAGAAVALMEWLELHPNPRSSSPIFCSIRKPSTGKKLTQRGMYKICETLAKAAGVSGRKNPHSFRHRAILEWLKANPDLSKASQLARHSDVRVTNRNYARWTDNELYESHQQSEWF